MYSKEEINLSDIKFVEVEEKEELLDDQVVTEEEFESLSRKERNNIFDEIRKKKKEGGLSNTPSSKSKKGSFRQKTTTRSIEEKDLKIVNKGLDYLKIGFYGRISNYRITKLDREQRTAEAYRGTNKVMTKEIQGYNFKFLPNGSGNYSYMFINDLIRVYVGQISKDIDKKTGKEKYHFPNIMVDIQSVLLNQLGLKKCYELSVAIAEEFTVNIEKEKVSRIDLFADIFGADELNQLETNDDFVCKARNGDIKKQDKIVSGHYFGSRGSKVYARIYNKSKEISYKGGEKDWFYDLWDVEKDKDNPVWRAEFQLGRKFFSDFFYTDENGKKTNIETFEDVQNSMLSMWRYLTTKWIRLCYNDNQKAVRRTVYPLWKKFQDIESMEGTTVDPDIIRGKTALGKREQYVKNAAGNITSIVASSLGNVDIEKLKNKNSDVNKVVEEELEKAIKDIKYEIRKKLKDDVVRKYNENQFQV